MIANQDEADGLPGLAHRINAIYREGVATVLDHARRLGELLLRAKDEVGHGGFTHWIEENCLFSVESARNYMRVAAHWDERAEPMAANRQCLTDLSLTARLRVLARPRGRGRSKVAEESTGEVDTSAPPTPEDDGRPTLGETTTSSAEREPDVGPTVEPGAIGGGLGERGPRSSRSSSGP